MRGEAISYSTGVGFGRRALPEKLESEVSRCRDGKHAEQRGQHSNEIANVLHFHGKRMRGAC